MRKVLIPVAVIALAIAAAAIGGPFGGQSEEAAAATGNCAKANLNLVKDGQLSIGTDNPAFPPWFAGGETKGRPWKINDPAKGKGFESAVAYAVAKRLGFTKNQVVWVYTPFNKAIAPGKKGYDFDINQISYTPERANAFGHGTVEHAVDVAGRAHARRLVLTHHGPLRTDDAVDRIAAAAGVDAAREGMTIDL